MVLTRTLIGKSEMAYDFGPRLRERPIRPRDGLMHSLAE